MKKIIFAFLLLFNVAFADSPVEKTFNKINQYRKSNGLNVLTWNDKLEKAAKSQTDWMSNVGVMIHTRGNKPASLYELQNAEHHPVDRIIKSGYYSFEKIYTVHPNGAQTTPNADDFWGEIIAHGKPGTGSNRNYPFRTDILVNGWINSPGHKAQMLKPGMQEMAVAYTVSRNGDVFWCVVFAKH
jgi:uncharacterized protein YkwD